MGDTHYVGDATHLIGCIMVVGPCTLGVGCDQIIATDIADNAAILCSCGDLISSEDELYKPSILFHLMAQSLCIVAVDLYMTVESLNLFCAVECIISVLCFIVL